VAQVGIAPVVFDHEDIAAHQVDSRQPTAMSRIADTISAGSIRTV
jgi:hypothetical protein